MLPQRHKIAWRMAYGVHKFFYGVPRRGLGVLVAKNNKEKKYEY